jgi:hypothetical protein
MKNNISMHRLVFLSAFWATYSLNLLAQDDCAVNVQFAAQECNGFATPLTDPCKEAQRQIAYFKCMLNNSKVCEKLKGSFRSTKDELEKEYQSKCGQSQGSGHTSTDSKIYDSQAAQQAEITRQLQQGQTIVNEQMDNIDQKSMQREQLYDDFSSAIDQANHLGSSGENGPVKSSKELSPGNKSGDNYIRFSNQMLLALMEFISQPYTDRLSPRRITGRTDKNTGVTTWWGFSTGYILQEMGRPVIYDLASLNARIPPTVSDTHGAENLYLEMVNMLDVNELYNDYSALIKQMSSGSAEMKFTDRTGKNIYMTHLPMYGILQSANLDKALHYLRDFSW